MSRLGGRTPAHAVGGAEAGGGAAATAAGD